MRGFKSPLDRVTVAAPCDAGWENMVGDERVRFCARCSLNVYNLSGMTKREAERLVIQSEGRLCIRFYRRADGTILIKNCPVGWRALKVRAARVATATASAALSFFAGLFAAAGLRERAAVPAMPKSAAVVVPPVLPELPEDGAFVLGPPEVGETAIRPGYEYVAGRMQIRPPKQHRFKRH